jgi:hypothetical protein
MVQDYDAGGTFRPLGERTDTGTLFDQTMGVVAVTVGLFTLGTYLARNLSGGWAMAFWIASFLCLLAMNLTVRQSELLTLGLLFGFGLLVGLATAPTIAYYANVDPEAVWEAGGATALFYGRLRRRRLCDATKPLRPRSRAVVGADRTLTADIEPRTTRRS